MHDENVLRMILMIAACFAIGSVGFFFAVLLQRGAQGMAAAPVHVITPQERQAAMQSVAASEAGQPQLTDQQKQAAMQSVAASMQTAGSTSTSVSNSQ